MYNRNSLATGLLPSTLASKLLPGFWINWKQESAGREQRCQRQHCCSSLKVTKSCESAESQASNLSHQPPGHHNQTFLRTELNRMGKTAPSVVHGFLYAHHGMLYAHQRNLHKRWLLPLPNLRSPKTRADGLELQCHYKPQESANKLNGAYTLQWS